MNAFRQKDKLSVNPDNENAPFVCTVDFLLGYHRLYAKTVEEIRGHQARSSGTEIILQAIERIYSQGVEWYMKYSGKIPESWAAEDAVNTILSEIDESIRTHRQLSEIKIQAAQEHPVSEINSAIQQYLETQFRKFAHKEL